MNLAQLIIPQVHAQVASQAASTAQNVGSQTTSQLGSVIARFFEAIPFWITAMIVMGFFYFLSILVRRYIEKKFSSEGIIEEHKEIQIVVGRVAFFSTLVIGAVIALSIIGIDLAPIVAALAFGLGFALQDIIMNTVSGLVILASRNFTVGDNVEVDGKKGYIQAIQIRASIIKGFDGTRIVVPNSVLFKNIVVSKTSNPTRRVTLIMGVGYNCDLKKAYDITMAVIKNMPDVLVKPKPSMYFYEWGDYSINYIIRVWFDSKKGKFLKIRHKLLMDLNEAYNQAGLDIPYPIYSLEYQEEGDPEETSALGRKKRISTILTDLKKKKAQKKIGRRVNFPSFQEIMPETTVESNNSTPLSSPPAPENPPATLPVSPQPTIESDAAGWLKRSFEANNPVVKSMAEPQSFPADQPASQPAAAPSYQIAPSPAENQPVPVQSPVTEPAPSNPQIPAVPETPAPLSINPAANPETPPAA